MRYLILSDIHGNLQALEAAVEAARGHYDQAVCCGDLVGYGADPNAVVEWVRANCPTVVRGNHDRACTGLEDLEWFNPVARTAAVWAQRALSPGNADYVRSLPKGPLALDGFQVAHGSPFDEDEYVVEPDDAAYVMAAMGSNLVFFGHTHIQGGFLWDGGYVMTLEGAGDRSGRREMTIDSGRAYMVNPGSVGQPRDDDPRASFAIYDSESRKVVFRREPYDVGEAQRRIREAGLPPVLAERLTMGR